MIYLIGGSPRGGKSILSRKLSKKLNIPYISSDTVKLVLRPYFKGKKKYEMFPFDKIWHSLKLDDYFLQYSGQQMINIDIREGKTIWPAMKNLIQHYLDRKIDYIYEGVHLLPSLVKEFRGNNDVKTVFLTKQDEEKIYQGMFKNKGNRDWIMDNTKNKDTIRLAAKSLSIYGNYFLREARKYNFKCINTEDNFSKKLNEAMQYLIAKKY